MKALEHADKKDASVATEVHTPSNRFERGERVQHSNSLSISLDDFDGHLLFVRRYDSFYREFISRQIPHLTTGRWQRLKNPRIFDCRLIARQLSLTSKTGCLMRNFLRYSEDGDEPLWAVFFPYPVGLISMKETVFVRPNGAFYPTLFEA